MKHSGSVELQPRWVGETPALTRPPSNPRGALSRAAKKRMLAQRGEPLFLADWAEVLMIHFEVNRAALQRVTPFPLELFEGRAFVSLVPFTMRRMRPRLGGSLSGLFFRPIATHQFLNVRTYVRHGDVAGIHFLAEWLPNAWSVRVGPTAFGLPYRLGRFSSVHHPSERRLTGRVVDARTGAEVVYRVQLPDEESLDPCDTGSLDEWLMERYTAFTHRAGVSRLFHVWHPPWTQTRANVELVNDALLIESWPWLADLKFAGANYSPGFRDVWMGRPQRIR